MPERSVTSAKRMPAQSMVTSLSVENSARTSTTPWTSATPGTSQRGRAASSAPIRPLFGRARLQAPGPFGHSNELVALHVPKGLLGAARPSDPHQLDAADVPQPEMDSQ